MTRAELGMTIEHNGQPKLVQELHQFPELVSAMSEVEQKPELEDMTEKLEFQELPDDEANNTRDSYLLYVREIARHNLLSAEEEIALAKTMETGKVSVEQLAELGSSFNDQEREQLQSLVSAGEAARQGFIIGFQRMHFGGLDKQ